jgi:ATP-binding cassette subfamily B protein
MRGSGTTPYRVPVATAGFKLERQPWLKARASSRAGLRLMFDTDRRLAGRLFAVSVVEGLLPTAFTVLGGRLVAAAEAAESAGGLRSPAGRRLLVALGLVAAVFLLREVIQEVSAAVIEGFRERVEAHKRDRVMAAVLGPPGVAHLEDATVLDLVRVGSRSEWPNASAFTMGVYGLTRMRVMAFTSALLVAAFRWWLAVLLLVLWTVCGRVLRRGQAEAWADTRGHLRRAGYLRDLAFEPAAAKEVRVFGLSGWLLDSFSGAWHDVMRTVWRRRRGAVLQRLLVLAAVLIAHGVAFAVVVQAARNGEIGPDRLVVLVPAIMAVSWFGNANSYTIAVALGAVNLPAIAQLEELVATTPEYQPRGSEPPPARSARGIRFEGVSFRYPSRDAPVYEGLDLTIDAGRSLAIVGANGAGKTTLVKLLARLYEPTAGRITVDGVDIATFDPPAWQRRVAAIFQDFVQYPMTAADNVGFGAPEHAGDRERLAAAAGRVGALELIESLPQGWDTVLTRHLPGGTELSGGQWQRLALARALFAVEGGASVLVLDEPTANLDVRSEVELFNRFLEVTRGVTTILISHRFSTVRRADRIVVLEGGRVGEEGTHDELVAAGGHYAAAFRLQAGRYEEAVDG